MKAVISVALLLGAGQASAALVLDQSAIVQPVGAAAVVQRVGLTPPPPNNPGAQPVLQSAVQTFTAGSAGRLASIHFQAANLGPTDGFVRTTLIDGDYSTGARTALWSQSTPFAVLPSLSTARTGVLGLTFDTIGADFQVQAGTRYSVLFEAEIPAGFNFAGLVIGSATPPVPGASPTFYGTDYAGGALFGIANGALLPASRFDVGFESFVETAAAVPEPATWALMIMGFGATGTVLRRRALGVRFA